MQNESLRILGIIIISLITLLPIFAICSMAGTITKKAGYSRWYGVLIIIPIVNLLAIYVFAFSKWPNEKNT